MAQEYHGDGDGDVDGLLRKIDNTSVTIDEQKACYTRETKGLEVTKSRGTKTSW
jgi:hypothetical protein